MSSKTVGQILRAIDLDGRSEPSVMEFEMAYQARIAIDRIRFAIKHTEHFARHSDQAREASLQLVDALDRLETADRHFQRRFRGMGSIRASGRGLTNAMNPDRAAECGTRP